MIHCESMSRAGGTQSLGAAILNRYKNSGPSDPYADVFTLLSEDRQRDAEILGKALRLGAMLSGAAPGSLEDTAIAVEGDRLVLTLRGAARDLRGEAVERRLGALANRLDLEPVVETAVR